jgi:hypothetical protein
MPTSLQWLEPLLLWSALPLLILAAALLKVGWPNARDPLPKSVDLVLRSNPQRAVEMVDVRRIWKGELVYENLPLYGGGTAAKGGQDAASTASTP